LVGIVSTLLVRQNGQVIVDWSITASPRTACRLPQLIECQAR
jgi:hypothetical protein